MRRGDRHRARAATRSSSICEPSIADKTRALLERYAVMDDVAFEPIAGPAHQTGPAAHRVWTAPFVAGAAPAPSPRATRRSKRCASAPASCATASTSTRITFRSRRRSAAFLDYGKGCYVGQEPVFRVHAQGNSARALRGLAIAGGAPIAAGAAIKHPTKDNAGAVTSSVADGDGVDLALGYLHRTCWDAGRRVEIAGPRATVHELPW